MGFGQKFSRNPLLLRCFLSRSTVSALFGTAHAGTVAAGASPAETASPATVSPFAQPQQPRFWSKTALFFLCFYCFSHFPVFTNSVAGASPELRSPNRRHPGHQHPHTSPAHPVRTVSARKYCSLRTDLLFTVGKSSRASPATFFRPFFAVRTKFTVHGVLFTEYCSRPYRRRREFRRRFHCAPVIDRHSPSS